MTKKASNFARIRENDESEFSNQRVSPMPYLGNKDQNSDINFDFMKSLPPPPNPSRK